MHFETNSHLSQPRTAARESLMHYTALHVEELVAQRVAELERTIRDLRERQRQLEESANHDPLTGLANRNLLHDRFLCAVERSKRSGDRFSLLMIDLNGFKAVNDTYGHAAGDEVLVAVSQRLQAALRTCDSAARVGGDEFIIIIEAVHDPLVVASVDEKLRETLSKEIHLKQGGTVTIGASIGFSIYPDDGATLAQMTAEADKKMYHFKKTNSSLGMLQ